MLNYFICKFFCPTKHFKTKLYIKVYKLNPKEVKELFFEKKNIIFSISSKAKKNLLKGYLDNNFKKLPNNFKKILALKT